jgi:GNAT superfamily N-acetyltransferase
VIETVRLRQAVAEDEPLLYAIFAEERAEQFIGTGLGEAQLQPLIEMQYSGRRMAYAAQYPEAADSILLGEDGRPVGRLLVDRKPDCWRVVDVAVLAEHRGRGLGTEALKECQQQCEAAGARLELQVVPWNPARRLYERLGFHAIREEAAAVEMVWNPAR